MAFKTVLIMFALAAFHVPAILAKEFIVGDQYGWTVNYNYQAWAGVQSFYVGDKLVFNYAAGVHNVNKVNETAFEKCLIPSSGALETGRDVITLATPGKKWYICSKGKHCQEGNQKMAITVESALPAPAAAPSSATKIGSSTGIIGFVAVSFGALWMKYLV